MSSFYSIYGLFQGSNIKPQYQREQIRSELKYATSFRFLPSFGVSFTWLFCKKIGLCDVVWIVEYEANIQQFPNISLPGILIILRFETSVNFDKFFGP